MIPGLLRTHFEQPAPRSWGAAPTPRSAPGASAVVALLLAALSAAPASAAEGPKPIDPRRLAAVQEVRAKILRTSGAAATGPLKTFEQTIPGTVVKFTMVAVPAGTFTLGSPAGEKDRRPDEGPQRPVTLQPFWIGRCEVTWDEYELFMYAPELTGPGENEKPDAVSHPTKPYSDPSFGMGIEGCPAVSMTHHAANKYCEWLSAKTGQFYRLPTEAEWEYAARAGTTTAFSFGDGPAALAEYAWCQSDKYAKVAERKPNPWGLFDMHGNVAEWTLDQYQPDAYTRLPAKAAPGTWVRSTQPYPHVVRGGSWNDGPVELRSAARRGSSPEWKKDDPGLPKSVWYLTNAPWVGFRLVRPREVPTAEEMYRLWNNGVAMDR
ncbi:MAG: formylglycine-generating enzyme family protein [Verrucomicrobia bacterium]|nr:formylglycine-generating enzyme family protein [Verrucomicrobiota bacterium]